VTSAVVYDLVRADTTLLRLIGEGGTSAPSIQRDPAFERSRVDALIERGYVWVACPDDGPVYFVSDLGTRALLAADAGVRAARGGRPAAASSSRAGYEVSPRYGR